MSLELFQWESTWLSAEREGLLQEGTRAPLSLALGPLLADFGGAALRHSLHATSFCLGSVFLADCLNARG